MRPSRPQRLYALLTHLSGRSEDDWARVNAIWNPAWRWSDAIVNHEAARHDADLEPVTGPLGWQLMALGPDREPHPQSLPDAWAQVLGPDHPPMGLLEATCLRLWQAGGERAWRTWAPISGSTQPPVGEALHQGWLSLAEAIATDPACPHLGQLHFGCFGPIHTPLHVDNPGHLALVLRHGASPDWPTGTAWGPEDPEEQNWRAEDGPSAIHGVTSLAALETLLDAGATTTPLTPVLAPTWPEASWGDPKVDTVTWVALSERMTAYRRALGVDPQPGRHALLIQSWRLGRWDLAAALGGPAWLSGTEPLCLAPPAGDGPAQGVLAAVWPDPTPAKIGAPWPHPQGLDRATPYTALEGWPDTLPGWEAMRQAWLVPALTRPDLLTHWSTHAFAQAEPLTCADGRWAFARWVAERVGVTPERRLALLPSDTDPTDPAWHALGQVWGPTPAERWTAYIALCLCHPGPGHWAHPWLLSTHPLGQVLGPLVLADLPSELLDFWAAAWRADQDRLLAERALPIRWDRARWTLRGRYPPALIEAVLAHEGLTFPAWADVLFGEWVLQQRLEAAHDDGCVLPPAPTLEERLVQWGQAGHQPSGPMRSQPETRRWLARVRAKGLTQRPSTEGRERRRV